MTSPNVRIIPFYGYKILQICSCRDKSFDLDQMPMKHMKVGIILFNFDHLGHNLDQVSVRVRVSFKSCVHPNSAGSDYIRRYQPFVDFPKFPSPVWNTSLVL